jgi:hypothetical protein
MVALFHCKNCKTPRKMDYVGPLVTDDDIQKYPILSRFADYHHYTCRGCKSTFLFKRPEKGPSIPSSASQQPVI